MGTFRLCRAAGNNRRFSRPSGSTVSREVQVSLQLAPVPWGLRGMPNPSVTEDDYWRLPPEQRVERRWQLSTIPQSWSRQPDLSGQRIYEALQAPLYYWL